MGRFIDYYEVLGVSYNATRQEIREAYEIARKRFANNPSMLNKVIEAWGVLGSEVERKLYDRTPQIAKRRRLHAKRQKPPSLSKTQIISPSQVSKTQIIAPTSSDVGETKIINPDDIGSKTVIHPARDLQLPHVSVQIKGPDGSRSLDFRKKIITIGRPTPTSHPDIPLNDINKYVSRKHARLEIEGNEIFIIDSSVNGTWLNGTKIEKEKRVQIHDGDAIQIEDWELTIRIS